MRFFPFLILILVVFTGGVFWLTQGPPMPTDNSTKTDLPAAQIGGEFSLTDHNGKQVTDKDFHGKLVLVFFGFTHCPDICPTTLATMSEGLKQLGDDANEVAPLLVTVDPERDTPEALKKYLTAFDPRIIGLTGPLADIEALVKAYKGFSEKQPHGEGAHYNMNHTSYVYLMDKDGTYLAHMGGHISAEDIANNVRKYLVK